MPRMAPRAALAWLCAALAVVALAQEQQFGSVAVGARVPAADIERGHAVCYPAGVGSVRLADFDQQRNGGTPYVTVVASYYTGCTPGRLDTPTYTQIVKLLQTLYPGKVAFLSSLKNGVNDGTCEAWANITGSDKSTQWPYIVDDRSRDLVYLLFDAQIHPSYAVLDHCMRLHAVLGSIADQPTAIETAVEALLKNISQPCPAMEPAPTAPGPSSEAPATGDGTCAPAFGQAATAVVQATAAQQLAMPRTLAFHPTTGELWVGNNDTDSLTMLRADNASQVVAHVTDRAHYHYMDRMSSLAFDPEGGFTTCQESENNYDGHKRPNRFMGPTMYDPEAGLGTQMIDQKGDPCTFDSNRTCFFTHTDMLHASPLCMGLAYDPETRTPYRNVYWEFDGLNSTLIRYDFEKPHGPGSLDHSLANVRRYPDVVLTRRAGVPGHMQVDPETRVLYVADTGANRIVAVDADSGRFEKHARADLGGDYRLWSSNASTFEYTEYRCARQAVLTTDVVSPSGLVLDGNVLYVGEYDSGRILALNKGTGALITTFDTGAKGLMGLAIQPGTGKLWAVNGLTDQVMSIDVTTACATGTGPAAAPNVTFPDVTCGVPPVDLGMAVVHIDHDDGYLNFTMLGPEYGQTPECMACSDACDNDMLLMSGYLCHQCLPDNCKGAPGAVYTTGSGHCTNLIGQGYVCECDDGYEGDHCQRLVTATDNGGGSGGGDDDQGGSPGSGGDDDISSGLQVQAGVAATLVVALIHSSESF